MNRLIRLGWWWLMLLAFVACDDEDTVEYAEQASLSFGYARQVVPENVSPLRIPVTLSSPLKHQVRVTGAVKKEMNAKEGVDYLIAKKQIIIPAGESVGYFEVEVQDYFERMPERAFEFELVESVGADLAQPDICQVVINSEEGLSILGFAETLKQTKEDAQEITIDLNLSKVSDQTVNFRIRPQQGEGTAVCGTDYNLDTLKVYTIPAGQLKTTVSLQIIDDLFDNDDRSFVLEICDNTHTELSAVYGTIKITIQNDEEPIWVKFARSKIEGVESDTVWIPVKIEGTHKLPVKVKLRALAEEGKAQEGKDFRFLETDLTLPVGCWMDSVRIEFIDNERKQAVRNFRLGFAEVEGAMLAEKDTLATVVINDEDFDLVELYDKLMGDWTFIPGEGCANLPSGPVTVHISGGDTPQEEDDNYMKYLVVYCENFGQGSYPARWRMKFNPKDGSLQLVLGEIFVEDVSFGEPVDFSWRRMGNSAYNDLTPVDIFHTKDYNKLILDPDTPVRGVGVRKNGKLVWWLTMKNCVMVRNK